MLRIGGRRGIRVIWLVIATLGMGLAGVGAAPLSAQGAAPGQIAFFAPGNLFLLDLATNDVRQLTQDGVNDSPAWSPDGQWLAFTWRGQVGDIGHIFRMRADGSERTQLTNGPGDDAFPAYGPDGALFFTRHLVADSGSTIQIVRLGAPGGEQVVHAEQTGLCAATSLSIAPDGAPTVAFDCGRGKYLYRVDPASNTLVDITQNATPALNGCAVSGVWARSQPLLAVLVAPDCGPAPYQLATLDFATNPPRSRSVPIKEEAFAVDWSPDATRLVYGSSSGLWVTDLQGLAQQYSTHGTEPAWRPTAGGPPPGMPSTGQGGILEMALLALSGAGLLFVSGVALRRRAARLPR